MGNIDSGMLMSFVWQFAFRLPIFLIWLIGLILCVVNYAKYPKTATRCGIACLVLLLATIISVPVSFLPVLLYRQYSAMQVGYLMTLVNGIVMLISLVGDALLIWAVWTREQVKGER